MLKIGKVQAKTIFIIWQFQQIFNLAVQTTIPNIVLTSSKKEYILMFELSVSIILPTFQSNILKINF